LDVYLVDGTYELFRHYYALPSARDSDGREVTAVGGVLASVLGMIKAGATHIGVATDHVIESFRNGLWPGYKTAEGIEPDPLAQFPMLEEVLSAAAIVVWPMVEFEADDALAAGEQRLLGMSVSNSDHLHTRQGPRPMREGHGIVHGAMPDRDIREN
jgi:5'-3' exonuclease